MKAEWKDATKELPPKRIRVLVCDGRGYMQTAFYGRQSSIAGSDKECWRTDEIYGMNEKTEEFTIGLEPEVKTAVVYWDHFPENPFPKPKGWPFE